MKRVIVSAFITGIFCAVAIGAERTWNGGGGNGLWSTAGNWDALPGSGDSLTFAGSVQSVTTNDFSAGIAYGLLLFASGADAFTLSGNSIKLTDGITNSSANIPSIELDVELDGNVLIDNTGANIEMDGVLSGDGFTLSGGKYLRLYNANTFTGDVTITSGDMSVYSEDALGSTNGVTYVQAGGQLRFNGTNVVEEIITIAGDSTTEPRYDGALRVDSGRTEFKGEIIAQSSRIKCGNGHQLILSGGLTGNSCVIGADTDATIIITNKPVVVDAGTREHFHSGGNIILAVTNNFWGGLQIAGCKFRTDVPYALPAGKYLEMGVSYSPSSYFNMNGNDQSIGTLLHNGLNASNVGTCRIWSDQPATLTVNQAENQTIYPRIEGAVSLVKAGPSKLSLGFDTSTTTGRIVVTEGRLGIAGEGSLGANPSAFVADQLEIAGGMLTIVDDVTLDDSNRGMTLGAGGGTFEVYPDKTLTVDTPVAGAGGLIKVAEGDMVLLQVNTYAGLTEIRNGNLVVSSEDQLGTAPASLVTNQLLFGGGWLRATSTFAIDDANRGISLKPGTWGGFDVDAGQTLTVENEISGEGYFAKHGEGTLILGAANTFAGRFNIEGGVVEVDSEDKLGANPAAYMQEKLTLHGGTLKTTASFVIDDSNRGVRMAENGGTFDVDAGTILIVSNVIDGAGDLVKTGDGTLVLAAANVMTGTVRCDAGTLEITNPLAVQDAVLDFSGAGTILFNVSAGSDIEVGGLNGEGDLNISSGNLIVGNQNATSSFAGDISGSGGLEKVGTGTFTLSGSNTYAGVTLVSSGRLMVEKRNALYEGDSSEWTTTNIIVESGASLGYYVGGDGEFMSSDIDTLCNLGSASGGYKIGSSIAFNTTNAVGGVFSYANVIPDPGGNTLGLQKYGLGTLELTADNAYTGPTVMYAGVLSGDSFEDGGIACSIGAASSAAGSLIFQGGVLRYVGSATVDMDRIITFGSGGGYRAKFDIADAGAVFEVANVRGSVSYGLRDNGVFEKYGPGTLMLGNDDIPNGGAGSYICGSKAFEIYEGTMANSSDDFAQLNVRRYEEEGAAILLGDGADMAFGPPLNEQTTGRVQVVRYIGTDSTAYCRSMTLCGPGNNTPSRMGFNFALFDVNDGAADVDLEINGSFGIYPNRPTAVPPDIATTRLVKGGGGTLRLNGTTSIYKETTVVRNGRLLIDADIKFGGSSVLGDCTNDVWICDDRTESGDVPFLAFEGSGDRTVSRGIQVKPASGAQPTIGAVSDINVDYDKGIVLSNNLWLSSVSIGSKALKFNAAISGVGGIVKVGSGVAELHAANTYTGVTEVAEGILRFGASGSVSSASALEMSGGVIELDGTDQSFALLMIDGDGEIDFSDGDSILTIGDSSDIDWSGMLLISNWDGNYSGGGGNDQLFIGTGATLSEDQLAKLSSSKAGATAKQLPTGEVVFKPSGTLIILR